MDAFSAVNQIDSEKGTYRSRGQVPRKFFRKKFTFGLGIEAIFCVSFITWVLPVSRYESGDSGVTFFAYLALIPE